MEETVKEKQVKTDNELIDAFYVSQGGKPSLKEDLWFYESDWNMLMSVVEKIESLDLFEVRQQRTMVKVHCIDPFRMMNIHIETVHEPNQRRQATYKCIVGFIRWYNTAFNSPPYKTIK